MAAASPSPSPMNIILLGAVGIGVYWFMTRGRSMVPGVIYPTPAQNQQAYADQTKAAKYQLLGGLLNKGVDFLTARANKLDPYNLATGQESNFGTLNPNGAGWGLQPGSSQFDGIAWNPAGNRSVSDSLYSLV